MSHQVSITAFYKFMPVAGEDLPSLQKTLSDFGSEQQMRGLTLLAEEGINGTVCGSAKAIAGWKTLLTSRFGDIVFKDSFAEKLVYPRWFVKVRKEIVTLREDVPVPEAQTHLTPEEWNAMLERDDVVVIDTRNDYETKIGMFENAIDPHIRNFTDFPAFAESGEIPKDKTVLMYCTGGIRCEKALPVMQQKGYANVYQLKGGILAYLERFPQGKFKGECFVFDHRVSVDGNLEPSKRYDVCPHCGYPGEERLSCLQCKTETVICEACMPLQERHTCSKDCRYRYSQRQTACAN